VEDEKQFRHSAQYSTRDVRENGIRDVSIWMSRAIDTKKYQITLSLFNEFAANEHR
jgi:hypothetical protein